MKQNPEESNTIPDARQDLSEPPTAPPEAVDDIPAVRTTGVDDVGLLTENRQPNTKPPTGG